MSEVSSGPGPRDPGPPDGRASIDRRAWSRERQWRVVALGTGSVLGVLLLLWAGNRFFGRHEAPPAAPAAAPGTFRATPQQLKTLTIEAVGERAFVSEEVTEGKIAVNGDRATPLYSPYSGRVIRVLAGLGDTVRKGAPLALIEASEFVQAQNDLSTAVAQRKLARINETRKHALYEAKGGSLQDWQSAQADLTAAETAVASVRNRLKILGKSDAEIDTLEAAPRIDPVATLTAPIAGVVVDRQVGPGQYLQAGGSAPVFTIADPSSVWLLANVREADSGAVHVGQTMDAHVPAYPQRIYAARVTYVAALIDPLTHRLPVRAEIDNRDLSLKPEMFANFVIRTSEPSKSAAVPAGAVIYEGDAAHVWVAEADGLLAYRAIRTGREAGREAGGEIEVLEGLKPGERVVTKGGIFIDQAAAPGST
jgi:cobalt-zinc-cadmium efflux system membrane fusion protein